MQNALDWLSKHYFMFKLSCFVGSVKLNSDSVYTFGDRHDFYKREVYIAYYRHKA